MKKILLSVLLLSLYHTINAQKFTWTIYYTPTTCSPSVYPEFYGLFSMNNIASDLATQLEKATHMKFTIAAYTEKKGPGIYLLIDSSVKYQGNEEAHITSDNQTYITIAAKYANGISYGVYTMLNRLGFKFYLPGDDWVIVPALKTFFYGKLKTIYNPAFKHRIFFSYLPTVKGIDEEYRSQKTWLKWCQRNRMGSDDLFLNGHVGEAYNNENSELLKREPERIAPMNNQRQFSISAKIDPTSKKSVEDYTNWAVEKFSLQKKNKSPCFPDYLFQSVDMGDGLNYCHTEECDHTFRSVSDQAYYIANIAAKKIRKVDGRASVNLYAYTERADTPFIHIDKNVHTEVVADAFQYISSPAMLMKKWSLKTKNFGSYSYLNEAPSSLDQPFYNLKQELNKLEYYKSLGSEGCTFETSASKFSAGLPQYFILKYLCEPYNDITRELSLFYSDCFNSCSKAVAKLFNSWYMNSSYTQTGFDYFTYMDDDLSKMGVFINDATKYQNDNAVKIRLEQIKVYFIYLQKLYELQNNPLETKKRVVTSSYYKTKFNEILNYTWHYYDSFLFQNFSLGSLLLQELHDPETSENWDIYSGNIAKYINRHSLPSVIQAFNEAREQLPPDKNKNPFAMLDDSVLSKLAKFTADSIRIQLIDAEALVGYGGFIDIYTPIPETIKIHYSFKPGINVKNNIGFFAVTSDDYKEVIEKEIVVSGKNGMVNFTLKRKGHYLLQLCQNQHTPATCIIIPGKSLLYINRKVLPYNSILLGDTTNSPLDNEFLGLYTGTDKIVQYHGFCHDCTNTLHFKNAYNEKLLPAIEREFPLVGSVKSTTDILFFKTDFFRWPPIFNNFSPYFFYFKKPPFK